MGAHKDATGFPYPALAAIFSSSVVVGILAIISNRNSLHLSPDSWGYWEGSVSMIENGRYEYLSGDAITSWPPLYSIYLASIQLIFGISGKSLALSIGILVCVSSILWNWYVTRIWLDEFGDRPLWSLEGIVLISSWIFVDAFLLSETTRLWAHALQIALLPLLLLLLLQADAERSGRFRFSTRSLIGSLIVCSILMMTHNASVAFVGATAVILMFQTRSAIVRLVVAPLFTLLALLPWHLIRLGIGQAASHGIGARQDPLTYAVQVLKGLGRFFVPTLNPTIRIAVSVFFFAAVVGMALTSIARKRGSMNESPGRGVRHFVLGDTLMIVLFSSTSLAILYLLFCVVLVGDALVGRFLWFIPLMLIPLVSIRVFAARKVLSFLFLAMFAAIPLKRCATNVLTPASGRVAWNSYITSSEREREEGGLRRMVPPTYPWQARSKRSTPIENDPR